MAAIKNVVKHLVDNKSNVKGYISQADRLKIKRRKDGSIHLKTSDKNFKKKKDAIRSDIIDKGSAAGYGHVFVDGVDTYGKFNTGKENVKTLGDVKLQKHSTGKKSAQKRIKATKNSTITEKTAIPDYMKMQGYTSASQMTSVDYQKVARYVDIRNRQLKTYKAEVKAQRMIDGNTTDGHLVSPHSPNAVNSTTQRFQQPGKNYIDEDGNQVIGNFGQGEGSGGLDRADRILLGVPENSYDDLVMFFDPQERGIRSKLTDKTVNEVVTTGNWAKALNRQGLNANEIFND